MKILVTGESNSVMRGGWVEGLRSCLGSAGSVSNFSIGSTGVFNILRVLVELGNGLSDYDVVLLDSQINDDDFFKKSRALQRSIYIDVLTYIKQFPLLLLLVSFPRLRSFASKDSNYAGELKEVGKNFDVGLVDIAKYLVAIANERCATIDSLYEDQSHPLRQVSYEVGRRVYSDFLKSYVGTTRSITCVKSRGLPYFFIDANYVRSRLKSVRNIALSNSMIKMDAFHVSDEFVSIECDDMLLNGTVVGLFYNVYGTRGYLRMESTADAVDKILVSDLALGVDVLATPVSKFMIWARPIRKELKIGRQLHLSMINRSLSWEGTEHVPTYSLCKSVVPSAQIVSVIVRLNV